MASRRVIKTFGLYVSLIQEFMKQYSDAGDAIVQYTLATGAEQLFIERELIARLTPIFNNYFNQSAQVGNQLVSQEVAVLTNALKVPFTYNVDLIGEINELSIFTGYYDRKYTRSFTKGEIDRLKRTILQAAYEGTDESTLADRIATDLNEYRLKTKVNGAENLTNKRLRLLARNETQRLRETTKTIYHSQPEVNQQFDRIWRIRDDNARPSHKDMDGKKAIFDSETGTYRFWSDDVGWVNGPGSGPVEFAVACRCWTDFESKS